MAATNLGQFTNNVNPSVTVSGASANPTAAGDKIVVELHIPNSNPTALTVTFDGIAMTEVTEARSTRSNNTILSFYCDDPAGRAAGKTLSAAWTNTGTSGGGGSLMSAGALTPANVFLPGGPDVEGIANGLSTAPSTGASGVPPDTSAAYYAVAVLGISFNTTGQETADNAYVSLPQAALTARGLLLDVATLEITVAPVGAKTETWTQTWGASKLWVGAILLFREAVPGAPVISSAPVLSGTPAVGSSLSVTDGTWTNTPTSFSYNWQRDVGSAGVTWKDVGSNQSCTTNNTTTLTVTSIAVLRCGQPVYGTGIPVGTVISAITDATHVVLSQAATNAATETVYFGAPNANAYTVTANDLGCELRCRVTAINATGSSFPSASGASSSVPAPASPTWRVVVPALGQSDNKTHSSTLALPVLPGETLVYLGGCSVSNVGGDIGSVTDDAGDVWTLRQDASAVDSTNGGGCQAFSTLCAAGMAFGAIVTSHIKATTVVGVNALNSGTVNVGDTTGFDPSGTVNINAIAVTYTGLTPTSLTGCGTHAAYTGGEAVNYHGQSPYWLVVAINPGAGATCSYDTGSAAAQAAAGSLTSGTVNTAGTTSVALGIHRRTVNDVFTPAAGWTKMQDGPPANAGNPYTGESGYLCSAEAQVLSAAQSGLAAAGTVPDLQVAGSVLVVFTITGPAVAAAAQVLVPSVRTVGLH